MTCFIAHIQRPPPVFSPARLTMALAHSTRDDYPSELQPSHWIDVTCSPNTLFALAGLRVSATASWPSWTKL
ncbi:MAG: hypothetical protein SVY53_00730 [Chloroflexota bacterium]|nr:hypothetical protein [Chloroflexota bacterium]